MTKKKEIKQIFENMEPESTEVSKEEPRKEPSALNAEQAGEEEAMLRAEMLAAEQEEPAGQESEGEAATKAEGEAPEGQVPLTGSAVPSGQEPEEENLDDILGDVRKSLLEEESQEQEQGQKWWKRIGRSSRKKKADEEPVTPPVEINLPALSDIQSTDVGSPAVQETDADEYQDKIDELIDLLDMEEEEPVKTDVDAAPLSIPVTPEPAPEPEKPVDLEELKKQAFQPRPTQDENVTEVRAIALEGDDEVFVEVEASKPDVLEERLSAVENALKPYQRYINFALAFLGLVMALIAALVIYNVYQNSLVQEPVVEEVSNLPFPISVELPGGWNFGLGKGSLNSGGNWNPAGAEWLQGTEVCRWVALPWSRQLEAVIRTLNPDDPIELGMSNNDKLVYNVNSIKQMSPEEMRELDSNSPCLLIVLAEPGAEERWVLTALP